MRAKRGFVVLCCTFSIFVIASLLMPAVASADPAVKVLLDELGSPKGLALDLNGDLLIGQGAFGPPAPVLAYILHGRDKGETIELTPPENVTDIATGEDGSVWAIGGDLNLYRSDPGTGEIEAVINIEEYQAEDPDPVDQEDAPTESNPYGLIVLPSGDALVADAAGNDVIRVSPDGSAVTVARLDVEPISTDHLPPEMGEFPPTIDAEAVPTSLALGPDGSVLVGELKGFPFRPGTSHIWQIDPDEEDAFCSVDEPDDCAEFDGGFTAIQDITWDSFNDTLYVYELAEDGTLAFEAGFETGEFPPAVLLQVKGDDRTELAEGQLSQPGGIVVRNRGKVYVTDGMFGNGRLILVRR